MSSFALELIRKGEQSLKSARILRDHDFDGSVNRSCYAMFNFARVTLLSVGVPEHDLPRTHSGVIAAFSRHAVQSGRIDLALAEAFVAAVRREFVLHESATPRGLESNSPDRGDKISEPGDAEAQSESDYPRGQPFSLEEVRRHARENWLRLRQQKRDAAPDAAQGLDHEQEL